MSDAKSIELSIAVSITPEVTFYSHVMISQYEKSVFTRHINLTSLL